MTRSHAKGAAYELEIVHAFHAHGFTEAYRVPMSGGHASLPGDIGGVPGLHIECKRQEHLRLTEWQAQAERDCPAGAVPILVYRRSRQASRVDLSLQHFFNLFTELFS